MFGTSQLFRLARLYSNKRWVQLSTLGRMAAGNGTFFARLEQGRVTIRSAEGALRWFSANWPDDLDWPEDIDRPGPDSSQREAA